MSYSEQFSRIISKISVLLLVELVKESSQEDRGHQSSGARAPELWCPHIFFRGFIDGVRSHIYAGSVPIKPGNVRNT